MIISEKSQSGSLRFETIVTEEKKKKKIPFE